MNTNNKMIIGLGGCGVQFIEQIKLKENNNFDLIMISSKDHIEFKFFENKIYIDTNLVKNIKKIIEDKDEIYIVNGLGGDSCQYLNIIVDELLKQEVSITIICTKPFKWEGEERENIASNILRELEPLNINVKTYENDDIKTYISEDEDFNVGFTIQFDIIYKEIQKD